MIKKEVLETKNLFSDKVIPDFIKNHPIFLSSNRVERKAFGGIGLQNFSVETDVPRSLSDAKREGGFLYSLLREITTEALRAAESLRTVNDVRQFLAPIEVRRESKARLNEVAKNLAALAVLAEVCEPSSAATFAANGTVLTSGGKIQLNLPKDVVSHDGKVIYKKGMGLFKFYASIREACIGTGMSADSFRDYNVMPSFKVFGIENMPNKKYQIVFSADGKQGAWDLITMSVRGTRSCQRWDGEYRQCLVGSVLSRFVGIIYLTSGAKADPYDCYGSLGTKMAKRCLVRYAIDSNTGTPCLILDKMYLNPDQEMIDKFISVLSDKAKYICPKTGKEKKVSVYYGPNLGIKVKHIYLPNESLAFKIRAGERTYQDTPLRTKREMDVSMIVQHQAEYQKNIDFIKMKFCHFITDQLVALLSLGAYENNKDYESVLKIMKNTNISLAPSSIAYSISNIVLDNMDHKKILNSMPGYEPKSFTRSYLKSIYLNRRTVVDRAQLQIDDFFYKSSSCEADGKSISNWLASTMKAFVRYEISGK